MQARGDASLIEAGAAERRSASVRSLRLAPFSVSAFCWARGGRCSPGEGCQASRVDSRASSGGAGWRGGKRGHMDSSARPAGRQVASETRGGGPVTQGAGAGLPSHAGEVGDLIRPVLVAGVVGLVVVLLYTPPSTRSGRTPGRVLQVSSTMQSAQVLEQEETF